MSGYDPNPSGDTTPPPLPTDVAPPPSPTNVPPPWDASMAEPVPDSPNTPKQNQLYDLPGTAESPVPIGVPSSGGLSENGVAIDADAVRALAHRITGGDPRDETAPLLNSFNGQYYTNTELGASANAQTTVYSTSRAVVAFLADAHAGVARTPDILLNWADASQELDSATGAQTTQQIDQLADRARQAPAGSR